MAGKYQAEDIPWLEKKIRVSSCLCCLSPGPPACAVLFMPYLYSNNNAVILLCNEGFGAFSQKKNQNKQQWQYYGDIRYWYIVLAELLSDYLWYVNKAF